MQVEAIVKQLTEIKNHAWGLLYGSLMESGDDVVEAAMEDFADVDMVNEAILENELTDWAEYAGGEYAMSAPFVDLLRLGHQVIESTLCFLSYIYHQIF